ncbi:MAG: alpha/beta hydrolase [Dehalococcoidia bacterium]
MPAVLQVEDRTVVLNGVRFHYRDWENEGAPALIVLHALGDCARDWDGLAEALNEDFRVLVLDQRGHGDTWWAPEYNPESWVEDLDAFARTLGLRSIGIVGHGMGARHAWRFAARQRGLVKRLVLIDEPSAAVGAMEDGSPALHCADFRAPDEAHWALSSELPWADERLLRRWVQHKFRAGAAGRWEVCWDARMRLPMPGIAAHDPVEDADYRREVSSPGLIVQTVGRSGPQAPPSVPGAHRVQLESNHPLLQAPHALIGAVREWL